MTKSKILSILLVVILVLTFVVTGCGTTQTKENTNDKSSNTTNNEEKVTLRFALWEANQQKGMEAIAAAFNKQNPNIEVKVEVTPWGDYWTKLDTAAQAKNLPDVFTLNATHIAPYARAGLVMDLTDTLKEAGVNLDDFVKPALDIYIIDGKVYALARDWDTIGLWYNKEMLKKAGVEPPKTWDDIVPVARAVAKANPGVFPFIIGYNETYTGIWNLIYQAGGSIIKPDLTSGWDQPGNKEALQFMYDLTYKYKVMPTPKEIGDQWTPSLLLSNKAAMVYSGTWMTGYFKENPNLDIAPIPMKPGSDVTSLVHAVGTAISSFTKYPDAAKKFVVFLASDEAAKILATEAKVLPAKKSAADIFYNNNPDYPKLREIIENATAHGIPHPKASVTGWEDVELEVYNKLFNNDITVDQAVKEIKERSDQILSRAK